MNKGHSITETAITVVILIILFAVFLIGLGKALDAHEQVECYKWQQQASQFEGYYLTDWQKQQCDHHNIIINAPIK